MQSAIFSPWAMDGGMEQRMAITARLRAPPLSLPPALPDDDARGGGTFLHRSNNLEFLDLGTDGLGGAGSAAK